MVKLICWVRRQPQLSHAEFLRHWREQHAPLILRHAAALRIRRYVQVAAADAEAQERIRASRGGEEAPYDGVGELWFDSLDDIWAVRQSPEGLAVLREVIEDERRFVDLARSRYWFGTERELIPFPTH
jgi:uncharacterized protein (TIGR02118 family)